MRNDANCIRPTLDTISAAMFRLQDLQAQSRDIADFATARQAELAIKQLSVVENGLMRHAAELPGFFGVS